MFTICPSSRHQVGQRLAFDSLVPFPPKVEAKVAKLVEELGALNRRKPEYKERRLELAREYHVDYGDDQKVWAVGLLALRRLAGATKRKEKEVFIDVMTLLRRKQVESWEQPKPETIEDVEEPKVVEFSGKLTSKQLDALESILAKEENTQLKRNLTDWLAQARMAEDHKSLIDKLDDILLTCPITLVRWENPVLGSDGYTYEARAVAGLTSSPVTRKPLSVVGPHDAAREVSEWLREVAT